MLALYVSLCIGWVDRKLTSLAYDYLAFSVMYKQFFENIHLMGATNNDNNNARLLCRHVSRCTRINGRDFRARALAARGDLCGNFTFFLPVFCGIDDIRNHNFCDIYPIRFDRKHLRYLMILILYLFLLGIKM